MKNSHQHCLLVSRLFSLFCSLSLLPNDLITVKADVDLTSKYKQPIAGYVPMHQVTDHAAIDNDQLLMQKLMEEGNMTQAWRVYQEGGFSRSYANVTLLGTTGRIPKNTPFIGTSMSGDPITVYARDDYSAGETSITLRYTTGDRNEEVSGCQVGAIPKPELEGCLKASGTLEYQDLPLSYKYDPLIDNDNARTLDGFSLQAEKKMAKCFGCPYPEYEKYTDYFGPYDYAHQYVMAAFGKSSTNFDNGNVDFSTWDSLRAIQMAIQTITVTMNVWMYTIREFEDALDDCVRGCGQGQSVGNCNTAALIAWDEGVAFYVGALEGDDGSGNGVLLYDLADKLCIDFKTCGSFGDATEGTSPVNRNVLGLSLPVVENLKTMECEKARVIKKDIVKYMTVPFVQGLLKAAYFSSLDESSMDDGVNGEAAAYAATVVPLIHRCNKLDASFIEKQLDYHTAAKDRDFVAIKETLERHYECIGVTCEQVGGLWDKEASAYYEGASPCASYIEVEEEDGTNLGLILGLVLGIGGGLLLVVVAFLMLKEKEGSGSNNNSKDVGVEAAVAEKTTKAKNENVHKD